MISALIKNERTCSSLLQTDPKNFQVTKFPVAKFVVIQSNLINFCQYDAISHPVLNGTRSDKMG